MNDEKNNIQCDVCEFENPKTHNYCGNCGQALALESPSSGLINVPLEGERKQVTIIFADISGFTALNDAAKTPAEVEWVVRLINECLKELSEAIYEFDGHIDKYIGDAIMAIFGAPKAHEDDPERALRAALSMQDRLTRFNERKNLDNPLGIHMGINTGTVIAGMVGTDRKRSYTVMGDAVNVASRLEGVSERGELLISETTYNLTQHLFEVEKRDPVKVKGKQEPLKIYRLIGVGGSRPKPPESPMIGREYEIGTLTKKFEELFSGQGNIVSITGDAGLGKSRLINKFRKEVREPEEELKKPLWLFGRALSYRQSFKNRLFVDILHSYLELPENPDDSLVKMRLNEMGERLFGARKKEVVPYLATLLGITIDEEAVNLPQNEQTLQQRTSLAMGEWVETLAARQPVVMIFEDLHWADSGSVILIEYLFTLTLYNPVLILCAARPERDSAFWKMKLRIQKDFSENFDELTLWPLTNEESRQLIKYLLKIDQMPETMEQLLLTRAEGNPLFLEEVLRSLIEAGVIEHTDGHWKIVRSVTEMDIPNTLQGVLTSRIDRLEDSVKRVLQVAAVIGRYFSRSVLEAILAEEKTVDEALKQLEEADLIEVRTEDPEPEYMFKHILTHETAYNSLLHQPRKVLHKKIADYMARLFWMLGEEYAPIVADHYIKSETWDRALRYLYRAGDAAVQSFANDEAVEFYDRALEVAEKIGEEIDQAAIMMTHKSRAKVLARLGKPQQAIADYEVMLKKARELNHDSAEMDALNGLGALHANFYDFSLALEFFQEALAVARRLGDETGKAHTLTRLGNFYYNVGQLNDGINCYREARDISMSLKDESLRIEAEDGLAKIILEQGEIEAALSRYKEEIIDMRRRLGYRTGLINSLASMLMAQILIADYKGAEETALEAFDLHKRSGDLGRVPFIKYYLALGQIHQGEFDAAHTNLEEGLSLAEEQQQKVSKVMGMVWLSYYYVTVGMNEKALECVQEGTKLAEDLGSPLYLMRIQAMLGMTLRHLGHLDEAAIKLENVYSASKKMGVSVDEVLILYQLARVYLDQENWQAAEKSTSRLIALASASGMKEFLTRGQWLQSFVEIHHHRYDEALRILMEASDLAEETDSRLSQYLIQIQKSYIYHKGGNNAASRDAMIYAQKIQKRLLESIEDETRRQTFLQTHHSRHLEEITEAYAGSKVKVESMSDEAAR